MINPTLSVMSRLAPVLIISNLLGCRSRESTGTVSTTFAETQCPSPRTHLTETQNETKARELEWMKSEVTKTGVNYQIYRFDPAGIGDLNRNLIDDWLIIRTRKKEPLYQVHATVVLDMPEVQLKQEDLETLVTRYFFDVPDMPNKTALWSLSKSDSSDKPEDRASPNDPDSFKHYGPLLPGAVTYTKYSSLEGLPGTEIHFHLAKGQETFFLTTAHDYAACPSMVSYSLAVTNPPGSQGAAIEVKPYQK